MKKTTGVALAILAVVLGAFLVGRMTAPGTAAPTVRADAPAEATADPAAAIASAPSTGDTPGVPPSAGAEVAASSGAAGAPAAPSPARTVSGNAAALAYTPFEASLLAGEMVRQDAATAQLNADDFDRAVDSLDAHNRGLGSDLAARYRAELEESVAAVGGGHQVDRFACGANICMTSIRTPGDSNWFELWYEHLHDTVRLPVPSIMGRTVSLPGGGREHRLLFTTRGVGGFYIAPPRGQRIRVTTGSRAAAPRVP